MKKICKTTRRQKIREIVQAHFQSQGPSILGLGSQIEIFCEAPLNSKKRAKNVKSVQNMWSPVYQSSSLEFYRDLFPWVGLHGTHSCIKYLCSNHYRAAWWPPSHPSHGLDLMEHILSLNISVPTSTGLPDGLHPTPPMGWTSWNTFFH